MSSTSCSICKPYTITEEGLTLFYDVTITSPEYACTQVPGPAILPLSIHWTILPTSTVITFTIGGTLVFTVTQGPSGGYTLTNTTCQPKIFLTGQTITVQLQNNIGCNTPNPSTYVNGDVFIIAFNSLCSGSIGARVTFIRGGHLLPDVPVDPCANRRCRRSSSKKRHRRNQAAQVSRVVTGGGGGCACGR